MSWWMRFRLDAFLVLNTLEQWLDGTTGWVDQPGPSADESEMQPEVTR
jgi:hypothetical protein